MALPSLSDPLGAINSLQPPEDSPAPGAAPDSTSAATPDPTPPPAEVEDAAFAADPLDHPEIADLKKNLQSGFHKLVAKRDQELQRLKSELEGLKGVKAKAEAWDRVSTDPEAAKALSVLASQGKTATQPVPDTLGVDLSQVMQRLPDHLKKAIPEPEHQKSFLELVDSYVTMALLPRLIPYQKWIEGQVSSQWQSQETAVTKELHGAEQYLPAARELAARSGLTLKQALLAVSDGAVLGGKPQAAPAQAPAPAPPPVAGMPPSVPRNQTIPASGGSEVNRDALARELEELYRRQTGQSFGNFFR